jgi:4'-phosphopantetheinyl transferase EntD
MVGLSPNIAFDWGLEHGRCVGVRLPDSDEAVNDLAESALVPEEQAFASKLVALRRRSWVGGRVAMRQALTLAGIDAPAVLPDERGAPVLPAGTVGSVSHKAALAVALVARGSARIGVDVELDGVLRQDISSHVLTDAEAAELAAFVGTARAREVVLRFSVKGGDLQSPGPLRSTMRRFQRGLREAPAGRPRRGRITFACDRGSVRDRRQVDSLGAIRASDGSRRAIRVTARRRGR